MTNPLLEFHCNELPPFPLIRPQHIEPALDSVINDNRKQLAALVVCADPPSWENLMAPLEVLAERLNRIWSVVAQLNAVVNTPELRLAYNACLPKLSSYKTDLGQNNALYHALGRLRYSAAFSELNAAQQKIVTNTLRDFRLSGIELTEPQKLQFKNTLQHLVQASAKFQENVLDATLAWTKTLIAVEALGGLPEGALAQARQNSEQRGLEGWTLTLDMPCYLAVITHANDRHLREEIYLAYVTRASDLGPFAGRWDNSATLLDIVRLRHTLARALGFSNYAERSLATKMAKSTDQVLTFLNDLAARTLPAARRELEELRSFARESLKLATLEAWDIPYASEKLKRACFNIDQEELRPYFPTPQVLQGLFKLVQRLYGLRVVAQTHVPAWHSHVEFFAIYDASNELRGRFYLDLFARANKRGGAWMADFLSRNRLSPELQTPVAFITCNFTPPLGDAHALLTHEEVTTLFHEFGHGLHHLLTRVDYPSVAGINGVAWDAVELPSQFMENWCWEQESIAFIARHYLTGAALPNALYKKLHAAKNFQSGLKALRQLEFALFDFRLHLLPPCADFAAVQNLLNDVRAEVAVVIPPDYNRFTHSFSHIFAGGYAAGYYSYKWAEVLSADAFAAFEESGLFNPETGRRFLQTVLEQGGTRDALALFVEFRGREPTLDALLRHQGVVGEQS